MGRHREASPDLDELSMLINSLQGKLAIVPFRIGLHPVGMLGGVFILVVFGW